MSINNETLSYPRAAGLLLALIVTVPLGACSDGDATTPAQSAADAALYTPEPDSDEFYAAPSSIPDVPGTVLKSRPITFQPGGVPLPNPTWQLQYVTRGADGRPQAAVTTVVQAQTPSAYGHPVLVSFQNAYDSLGAPCTPSHTATGDTRNSTNMAEALEYLPPLQSLGWTVTIPDYEGPHHAFGAGLLSGRATLDAVRATLAFAPLGLSSDTPVALWGYSGGAYASTWAASLQPEYAPELALAGVVSGGTPVDMFDIMRRKEGTADFNFLFTLVLGMQREYPDLLPATSLTEAGQQAALALKDACVGAPAADAAGATLPDAHMTDYVAAPDPYSTPGFVDVMSEATLLDAPLHPQTDIYLYHETNDNLVPIDDVDALAAQWCAQGVPLSYYRSSEATAVGTADNDTLDVHLSGAALGTPAAIAYIDSRFSGAPAPVTPPTSARCN